MVHAGGRGKAETKTIFPYSNAVREVDSTRARQTESSRSSMPLRWQHGRESQQGVTLLSLSPSPFPASTGAGMAGGRFDSHNPKASGRAQGTLMDGHEQEETSFGALFVQRSAVKAGGRGWREVQYYQPCLPRAWCYLLMSPCWRTCVYM